MSTWHQRQSKRQLYHPTRWTLLVDEPGKVMYTITFDTKAAAEEHRRVLKKGTVLSPAQAFCGRCSFTTDSLTPAGNIPGHSDQGIACSGSYLPPKPAPPDAARLS